MQFSFKNRKIKFDLVAAFILTMASTIIALIVFSSIENEESILDFSEKYAAKVSSSIANDVDLYFEEVESTAAIVAVYLGKQEPISEDRLLDKIFLVSLKETKSILSIFVAAPNNVFAQVRRIEQTDTYKTRKDPLEKDISYASRSLTSSSYGVGEIWQYLDKNGKLLEKEIIHNSDYIPTTRDWYKNTLEKKTRTWSDVYIFHTSKRPGITFSIPILNEANQEIMSVLGVDVTTNSLNSFLKENLISPRSKIYLINQKEEIIASSDSATTEHKEFEEVNLLKVAEHPDSILQKAFQEYAKTQNSYNLFTFDSLHYLSFVKTFINRGIEWKLLILAPTEDFVGVFRETQKKILIISSIIFLLAIVIFYLLAKRISMPLTRLGEQALSIKKLNFSEIEPINSKIIEIQQLSKAVQSMNNSINMFAKYVPKDLVRKLLEKEEVISLGGTKENITIMFSDIVDFTSIAERTPPEELMINLSEYFDEMTKIILKNKGTVDKYIGDAIMTLWGAPHEDKKQVINACKSAIEMQTKLKVLNQKWFDEGKPILKTRIGIHCGDAIVGNMGSQDRMNYTAIGDNVNLASRLEGLNKFYSSQIIVSDDIRTYSKDLFSFKVIDKVIVKGREKGITIYELLGPRSDSLEEKALLAQKAFKFYTQSKWSEAIKKYEELGNNPTSLIMIQRIKKIMGSPKNDSWDGSWHWTEK